MRQILLKAIGDWHYGRWLRFKHLSHVIPRLPCDLRRASILDAGCGEGAAAFWLARRHPGSRILGVDSDPSAVDVCMLQAAKQGLENVDFRRADLEKLPHNVTFDFIYLIHVLEYIPNDVAAVAGLSEALRPGGILLVDVVDLHLGADPNFGFRRFASRKGQQGDRLRAGYTFDRVRTLLEGSGLTILGTRHTVAPPALLAHTVFEALRAQHFRWYLVLLPLLRLIGYSDFVFRWKRGASLMVWATRR